MWQNIRSYFDLNRREKSYALLSIPDIMGGKHDHETVSETTGVDARPLDDVLDAEEVDLDKTDSSSCESGTVLAPGASRKISTGTTEARPSDDRHDGEPQLIPATGRQSEMETSVKSFEKSAWAQWLALFAGVLMQPFFQHYQKVHRWGIDEFSGWGWILFALIASVLIFPAVYRSAFDRDKPAIVQLAPIFAAGLGWQSLLSTVVKAAT